MEGEARMILEGLPRHGAVLTAFFMATLAASPALARHGQRGKLDPALACVGAKQRSAADYCGDTLRALARFEQTGNAGKRDALIAKAAKKLAAAWADAEATSSAAGTDCAAAFLTAPGAQTAIDSAGGALVGEVSTGLD